MVTLVNICPFSSAELILLSSLAIATYYYLIIKAYTNSTLANTTNVHDNDGTSTNKQWIVSRVLSSRFTTKMMSSSYVPLSIKQTISAINHYHQRSKLGEKSTITDMVPTKRSAVEFARLPDMWPDVLALLSAEDACSLTSVSRRLHGVGRQALLWQRLFAESFACEGGDLTCPRLLLARARPTRVQQPPRSSYSPSPYEISGYGMWRAASLLGDWVTPTLPGLATASIDTTTMDTNPTPTITPPTDGTMTTTTATPTMDHHNGVGIGLGLQGEKKDPNHNTASSSSGYSDTITFIDGKMDHPMTDIASIASVVNGNDSKRAAIHILSAPTPFKLHYADAHVRLRIDNATWLKRRRTDLQRRWPISRIQRPMAFICMIMWMIAWWRSPLLSPAIVLHWLLPSWTLLQHWSPVVTAMTSSFSTYVTSAMIWSHVQIVIALFLRTRVTMHVLCPAIYSLLCSDFAWLWYCWLRARPSGLRMRRDQKSLVHRHLADSLSPLVSWIPNYCWSDASSTAWCHASLALVMDSHQLRFMVYIIVRVWLAITAPWIEANFVVPLPLIIQP